MVDGTVVAGEFAAAAGEGGGRTAAAMVMEGDDEN